MKYQSLTFICFLSFSNLKAQSLSSLQAALSNPEQKIQAVHTYPLDVKVGDCHWVEITGIVLKDKQITITESWSNWAGNNSSTVLTGTIENEIAEGSWKSNYSSGSWSYNFKTKTGRWNKSNSSFGSFIKYEKLLFKIVKNTDIKDGFYPCQ